MTLLKFLVNQVSSYSNQPSSIQALESLEFLFKTKKLESKLSVKIDDVLMGFNIIEFIENESYFDFMISIFSNNIYADQLSRYSTEIFDKLYKRILKEYNTCLNVGVKTNIYITKCFQCIEEFIKSDPAFNVESNLQVDKGYLGENEFQPNIKLDNELTKKPLDMILGFFKIIDQVDFDDELIELFIAIIKRSDRYMEAFDNVKDTL